MKDLLRELEEAERIANEIDELWENNPDSEEIEREWLKAYKTKHEAFECLVSAVVEISNGRIDEKTARAIINGKREQFKKIVYMM